MFESLSAQRADRGEFDFVQAIKPTRIFSLASLKPRAFLGYFFWRSAKRSIPPEAKAERSNASLGKGDTEVKTPAPC